MTERHPRPGTGRARTTDPTAGTLGLDHTATVHRISGPSELVQAVPYLLGFHPRRSLVLVGLDGSRLIVTARLDLDDAELRLTSTLLSMCAAGTTDVVATVYDDEPPDAAGGELPQGGLVSSFRAAVDELACRLLDVLYVHGGVWWVYDCVEPDCCPAGGTRVPSTPSTFAAAATVAGVVPLPDRESLADELAPLPADRRAALLPLLHRASALSGPAAAREARAVKRALFAAARACAVVPWDPPDDGAAARLMAGLADIAVRDAVWTAIDDHRLDGRPLWRELARRAPAPYDAAPLFLFGWATWRSGSSALAGIAAERALDSDPHYGAANLLLTALSRGVDPRRLPRLGRRR